jgi:tetratricopeptide (TPR) repeat protein
MEARAALYRALLEDESLPAGGVLALFDLRGIDLAPETAQLAFELAPAALVLGDQAEAARLYNRGIELATAGEDIGAVRDAGYGLRDYLLAHPDLDRAEAYWPLYDDPIARERSVAGLDRADLYWRYRAEFGFSLLADRQLMREQPLHDEAYEQIFASISGDIERAYALNPTEHQRFRDFFVDGNIGWLYLRRGDDYRDEGNEAQALADYEKAAVRIQPASGNTALRLGQAERGAGWYDRGIDMVERLGDEFDLAQNVGPAIQELQALLQEQPELAPTAQPLLDRMESLR